MQTIVKPYADKNAVKVVAFAVQLTEHLSPDNLILIVAELRKKQCFDQFIASDQFEVSVTITQDGVVQQTHSTNGVIFEEQDVDQSVTWTASINKEFILVTCKAYTRWNEISPKALKIIDEIFASMKDINISQITLEYLDEFNILNPESDWMPKLFKENCNYILPSIYRMDSFWHINYGYFTSIEDFEHSLLDNLYLNYFADEQDDLNHKVNIRAQHKLDIFEEYENENITKYFNAIHLHSKSIFEEIVSDPILALFDRGIQE